MLKIDVETSYHSLKVNNLFLFSFKKAGLSLWILIGFFILGCSSTPVGQDDYALARSSIEAAKEVDAARFDPGNWQQAQMEYAKGEQLFKDEQYDQARESFRKSRYFAEKAENNSQVLRFKAGEVL